MFEKIIPAFIFILPALFLSVMALSCSSDDTDDMMTFPGSSQTTQPTITYYGPPEEEEDATVDDDDNDNNDDNNDSADDDDNNDDENTFHWETVFEDDFEGSGFSESWSEHEGLACGNGQLSTGGMKSGSAIVGLDVEGDMTRATLSIRALEKSQGALCEIIARAETIQSDSLYRGRLTYSEPFWIIEVERAGTPTIIDRLAIDLNTNTVTGYDLNLTLNDGIARASLIDLDGNNMGDVTIDDATPPEGKRFGVRLVAGESKDTSINHFLIERRVQ